MEGLDKAAWGQIATFFGVLIATILATFGGWFKDKIFKKPPSNIPSGPAVVMSAAIADSAQIATLSSAINRLCDRLDNDAQESVEDRRTMRNCIRDLMESTDRQTRTLTAVLHPFGNQRIAPPGEQPPPGS